MVQERIPEGRAALWYGNIKSTPNCMCYMHTKSWSEGMVSTVKLHTAGCRKKQDGLNLTSSENHK